MPLSGIQYRKRSESLKQPPTFEERSDDELLRLGRGGNEAAFLALYHRHCESVFRFALHMSGQRETAEEVTQEVFLALLADKSTYREERGALAAFLIGTARNQVRHQVRDARKLYLAERTPAFHEPVESFCQADRLQALRKAILALPESYRAVTVLCELEELSYADAAQRLGCAVGTVRSRLHRARAILEEKLRRRERCQSLMTR